MYSGRVVHLFSRQAQSGPLILSRDLPKYKPWMSARSWEEWEQFIENIDTLTIVENIAWKMLQILESSK